MKLQEVDLIDMFGKKLNVGDSVYYANGATDNKLKVGKIIWSIDKKWHSKTQNETILFLKCERGHIINLIKYLDEWETVSKLHLIKI